jgi:hypothetical protein
LGSSGSRVISAIISRSCGERTDDGSWVPFGKSALDEVAEGCATTVETVCFFFFFHHAFDQRDSRLYACERTNLLIRLVGHKFMIPIEYGRVVR